MIKNFFFSVADTEFIVTIYRKSRRVNISQVHKLNTNLPIDIICTKHYRGWSVWYRDSRENIGNYFPNLSYQELRQCIVKLLITC